MAGFFLRKPKRILVDVDTQYDLMRNNGCDHNGQLRQIRRLIAWARQKGYPVVSTALCRRPGALETGLCLEGAAGTRKISYTLLPDRITYGTEATYDLPGDILKEHQQVIFEKRSEDPFLQPRADRLLSEVKADEFIVFGMGVQTSIKATVLGLLSRGRSVTVVLDALESDSTRTNQMAIRQMEAKGAHLTRTETLTGKSHLTGQVLLRDKQVMGA